MKGGSSPLRVEARVESFLRRREEREAARAVGARDDGYLGDEVIVGREATHDGVARLVVGHLVEVRARVRVRVRVCQKCDRCPSTFAN